MNLYEKYVCTKRTGQMDKKLIAKIAGWELSSSEPESWPFRWVSQGFTGLTFSAGFVAGKSVRIVNDVLFSLIQDANFTRSDYIETAI